MNPIKKIYERIKAFCIAYPAFLSGFFIYGYLFLCILQYFFKVKSSSLFQSHVLSNIFESFDAFPFMWLLSVALVKVIDVRTKLHESEEQRILAERKKDLQQLQLQTLQEVTRGLQHHINNPLAIITLTLVPARRAAENNQDLLHYIDTINDAVNRITTAMEDFSQVREYAVESAGQVVGNIASPNTRE